MRFYLGTHRPGWLSRPEFAACPLFVSAVRLRDYQKLPRAAGRWALDSGGFSELTKHGRWTVGAAQYAAEVRRWRDEVGNLDWAAVQDWMCEPIVRDGGLVGRQVVPGTRLTVASHQTLTIRSYLDLMSIAPDLPWVPVLQGWEEADYLRHMDQYARWGVDLTALPVVGLGSVCRRQGTREAERIVGRLCRLGVRLHLFGFKLRGLARCGHMAVSADSLAWSYHARRKRRPMLPECVHRSKVNPDGTGSCANCPRYALHWRDSKVEPLTQRPADLFG